MNKKIIIDAHFPSETRVALLNVNNLIEEIEFDNIHKQLFKGNIYLAKVTRIEPSLQAAFVDYGNNKSGFLPFAEIHPDYYNIPLSDQSLYVGKLHEIAPSQITSEDLNEAPLEPLPLVEHEVDIAAIAESIDIKTPLTYDLSVEEAEIEPLDEQKSSANSLKSYKIQEVIKKGQVLLVQITKEERGSKGVSLTTYISLAGKYCVLMPNISAQNGISRKIADTHERNRLKTIISKLNQENAEATFSIIVRTAGARKTSLDIKRDYEYLAKLWNQIRETTLKSKAPYFIHAEDDIIKRVVRDMYDVSIKEIIVQGRTAYNSVVKFMQNILPEDARKITEYTAKAPIFTKFNIESQIASLYQPIVSLASGGYIVINPTEALISIDVNSGKATSERNIEETALKINVEAAKEIARHIKLRDLSGLLVIDFIDMGEMKNRKIVERSFKEFLNRDRARIQTNIISNFGLLELSRQRMKPSFLERHSSICNHCNGKGVVRADNSNSMLILRTIENEIFNDQVSEVNIYTHLASTLFMLNNKREEIALIESKYNIKLNFLVDHQTTTDSYSIEKIKSNLSEAQSNEYLEQPKTEAMLHEGKQNQQRRRTQTREKNKKVLHTSTNVVSKLTDDEHPQPSNIPVAHINEITPINIATESKTDSQIKVSDKSNKNKRKRINRKTHQTRKPQNDMTNHEASATISHSEEN